MLCAHGADTAGPEISAYLAADEAFGQEHPLVRKTVARLRAEAADTYSYAVAAHEFVRDTVAHSVDSGDLRVTWRASGVLEARNGICHSKSHAPAALLRAAGIPAALCYQGFADDDGNPDVLHALIAVRLPGRDRWDRQDPRGNKPGIDAQFSLDEERLAWATGPESNGVDSPVLYAAPHPAVLHAMQCAEDRPQLWRTLPTAF
ncbi:transglutaminase family protein [Streptomyces sp. NPDC005181]|uniref:transglutaminase-like domain-containing protein n=1 Tax=Streptomyces sp. NPDC005181 TaxID=3156869 RepID=UPI0033A6AB67